MRRRPPLAIRNAGWCRPLPHARSPSPPEEPLAAPSGTGETRAADAVTIFWMLTVLATLGCEVGLAAVAAYLGLGPAQGEVRAMAQLLFSTLAFTAILAGVVSLALGWAARALRRAAPPRSVAWAAFCIGGAPVVLWSLLAICQVLAN
jgi:hypothetical protein